MASQHIELSGNVRLGRQLRGLRDSLAANITALVNLKQTLDTFAGDYVAMGAALGLTGSEAAEQAAKIYGLLEAMNPEFADAKNTQTFLAILG